MSESGTTGVKEVKVGDTIADRFMIDEVLSPLGNNPLYRATDPDNMGSRVVLSQVGRPTKEAEPDKVKRALERALRALSWVRHKGIIVPKEFVEEGGFLFSVFPDVKGTPLDTYIAENPTPVSTMVDWVSELTAMLEQVFEGARRNQQLAQLPMKNVIISPDGQVQLIGFDLNSDLKLSFHAADPEAPKPTDAPIDERSGVWCLGKLVQQMVEAGGATAKKEYRENSGLRTLVAPMTNDDPEKRVANMSTLKSRLERLSWKDAPKPPTQSLVDAPITVLTVEEEDQFRELRRRYVIMAGVALLVCLLVALLGQVMFPNAEF